MWLGSLKFTIFVQKFADIMLQIWVSRRAGTIFG
jgi:hypothetical protein